MQTNDWEQMNSEAREWFALMQSGSVSEFEHQQWQQWLQASEQHREAYARYERVWQELAQLQGTAELAALRRSVRPSLTERLHSLWQQLRDYMTAPKVMGALALGAVFAIGINLVFFPAEPLVINDVASTTGEIKQIHLEDGSEVTLSAKSEIKTWNTKKERHVVLVSGQAFFKVAKNPNRPFWVDSGDTKVRVVGTQFDVHKGEDRTRVAVLEGIVRVSSAKAINNAVVLTAGQQVTRLNNGQFENVSAISTSELESWRHGRLIYLRARLADVVADANRYFNTHLELGSADVADLKVTAAVSTHQPEALTDLLSKSLPIVIKQDDQNHFIILSRDDPKALKRDTH